MALKPTYIYYLQQTPTSIACLCTRLKVWNCQLNTSEERISEFRINQTTFVYCGQRKQTSLGVKYAWYAYSRHPEFFPTLLVKYTSNLLSFRFRSNFSNLSVKLLLEINGFYLVLIGNLYIVNDVTCNRAFTIL